MNNLQAKAVRWAISTTSTGYKLVAATFWVSLLGLLATVGGMWVVAGLGSGPLPVIAFWFTLMGITILVGSEAFLILTAWWARRIRLWRLDRRLRPRVLQIRDWYAHGRMDRPRFERLVDHAQRAATGDFPGEAKRMAGQLLLILGLVHVIAAIGFGLGTSAAISCANDNDACFLNSLWLPVAAILATVVAVVGIPGGLVLLRDAKDQTLSFLLELESLQEDTMHGAAARPARAARKKAVQAEHR